MITIDATREDRLKLDHLEEELSSIETVLATAISHDTAVTPLSLEGRLVIIKDLLKGIKDSDISYTACETVVRRAALKSYFVVIRNFLVPGTISKANLGEILIAAARKDDLLTVQTLLAESDLSVIDKAEAMQNAAKRNRVGVLKAFLLDSDITEDDWAYALEIASRYGCYDIVQVVLAHGPISEAKREEAVYSALANGYPLIAKALLENNEFFDLKKNEAFCIKIMKSLVDAHHFELLGVLMISSNVVIETLRYAVSYGSCFYFSNVDLLKIVLAHVHISEPDRGEVVVWAARNGYYVMLKTLLANGSISEADREKAIKIKLRQAYGWEQYVEALLESNEFFDLKKNEAFCIKIMRCMIDSYQYRRLNLLLISSKVLVQTLIYIEERMSYLHATQPGFQLAFNILIDPCLKVASLISAEDRGRIATILSSKGDLKSLHILLESGPILDSDFKDCIKYGEARLELAASDAEEKKAKAMIEVLEKCAITTERAILVKSRKIALGDNTYIKRSDMALGAYAGLSEETIKQLELDE